MSAACDNKTWQELTAFEEKDEKCWAATRDAIFLM